MQIGVLALQGDILEHRAAFSDLGVATSTVRRPKDLVGIDGIVLPGGESTTMSMLLVSSGLFEPLSQELSEGLPAFGTCAGMILLAASIADGRGDQRSFGVMDIDVRRNGFGRQVESFECDLDIEVLRGGPMHAVFIRAPLVDRVGPDVEVLASLPPTDGVGVMDSIGPGEALKGAVLGLDLDAVEPRIGADDHPSAQRRVLCRQGAVLAAAFHPELTGDRRLHKLFVEMIEERGL